MLIDKSFTSVRLDKLFLCKYGNSKYTKAYCNTNKGNYEVFAGNTLGSFAFIDDFDYSEPNLTFSTDGEYAGSVVLINNEKYSIGGHRAVLKKLNNEDKIDLQYCYHYLKDKLFTKVKKGSVPSVRWNSIKNIEIKMPLAKDGTYDLDEQQRLASIYYEIEQKKSILQDRITELNNLIINIEEKDNTKYTQKTLEEIIDFEKSKTNNSKFTKAFINKHKGDIPVYGASKFEYEVGYGYVQDNLENIKYFENCLTWNIDGSCGIFYRSGRFSLSEKVIPLILFDKFINNIDLNYLRNTLMLSAEFNKFNFSNKAGKNKLKKIKISIPIKSNGDFDIEKQKEIAFKYMKLDEIKKSIIEKIKNLISIDIMF